MGLFLGSSAIWSDTFWD